MFKSFLEGFLGGAKGTKHAAFALFVWLSATAVSSILGGTQTDALAVTLIILYSELRKQK